MDTQVDFLSGEITETLFAEAEPTFDSDELAEQRAYTRELCPPFTGATC